MESVSYQEGMKQELSWESLPGWGCQQEGRGLPVRGAGTAARGCQMHQLMGLGPGLGGWGFQLGGPGTPGWGEAKPLAQSPPPSTIGLLPWLDKTFREEPQIAVGGVVMLVGGGAQETSIDWALR